jgi:hypothetical protein
MEPMIDKLVPASGLGAHGAQWNGNNYPEIETLIGLHTQTAYLVTRFGRLWVLQSEADAQEAYLYHYIVVYLDGYVAVMSRALYLRQWQVANVD